LTGAEPSKSSQQDVLGAPSTNPGEVKEGRLRLTIIGIPEGLEFGVSRDNSLGELDDSPGFGSAESEIPQVLGVLPRKSLRCRETVWHFTPHRSSRPELLGQSIE
jgi:hypothetical protein